MAGDAAAGKLNKLICFQKNITIFQKIFNNKYDKINNFKLLIKNY